MRIIYGIQSTGKGHLSRFLGMLPYFREAGHEMLVFACGYEDPPGYFLKAVSDLSYRRFQGVSYVSNHRGGISKSATVRAFARHVPNLLGEIRRVQEVISRFAPDLIVSDFDPLTGSPFVAPGVVKVGLSHQSALFAPGTYHPEGRSMEKFFTRSVVEVFTAGLDHALGCHFYPANRFCLPPIIRPAIRNATPRNDGHIVVYHTLSGMLAPVCEYARAHPDRQILVYGYRPANAPSNIEFRTDPSGFAADLASADAYVGTAGFQSISEAFFLGKKIAAKPLHGQYEQVWNAAQLEHWKMGRWHRDGLEGALDQQFNEKLHRRLLPWFRGGARECYERIISCARGGEQARPTVPAS